jgi:hypothetical protein
VTHLLMTLAMHHHHYPHITPLPPPSMGGNNQVNGNTGLGLAAIGLGVILWLNRRERGR